MYEYYVGLEIEYWQNRSIRFYDAFPAICYAYGIDFSSIPSWMFAENSFNTEWNVEKQIQFVQQHGTRTPTKVFEIGAGRGDISCFLQYLGVFVDSCELHDDTKEWFYRTAQHFFGYSFRPTLPLIGSVHTLNINWKKFDTILMVECLEHITEENFLPVWESIKTNFKGRFIVTNFIGLHPIQIGGDWPEAELHHCRLIDDAVYDKMSNDASKVILRQGSHLVLEF